MDKINSDDLAVEKTQSIVMMINMRKGHPIRTCSRELSVKVDGHQHLFCPPLSSLPPPKATVDELGVFTSTVHCEHVDHVDHFSTLVLDISTCTFSHQVLESGYRNTT